MTYNRAFIGYFIFMQRELNEMLMKELMLTNLHLISINNLNVNEIFMI